MNKSYSHRALHNFLLALSALKERRAKKYGERE